MTHADAHTPLAWQTDAACTDTFPDLWFPDAGGNDHAARAICGRCSVAASCLKYAIDNGEEFGMWGGVSAHERRVMRRQEEGRRT
jgi:WhiB family redox-sensing transcriptional regulator